MPTRKKIDYSGLSIQTLKVELAICGVNTDTFLEKSEFVKALEDVKKKEKKMSLPRSKFAIGEKVLYISGNGDIAESAKILEVNWIQHEGDANPYYTIRLDVSQRERQTDDAHLVALPGKEPPQLESKSDGKLKKAFGNLKNLGRNDLSSSSNSSVEPKSRSLPLRTNSFPLSLLPRRKDDPSPSTRSSKPVDPKRSRSLPIRASSFSVSSLLSRKKDELSSVSTHSTSTTGSISPFFHKPEKPQRRTNFEGHSSSRVVRQDFSEVRPINSNRRSSLASCTSRRSSVSSISESSAMSMSLHSMGSQNSDQVFKTRRSASTPSFVKSGSVSGFAEQKNPSLLLRSSSRKMREKRHSLRPSPPQAKGRHATHTLKRNASLPIVYSKPRHAL